MSTITVDPGDPGDRYCFDPGDDVKDDAGDRWVIVSLTDKGAVLRRLRWWDRAWRWLIGAPGRLARRLTR